MSSVTEDGKLEECPTCGRDDFKNERGVKLHHAKAHGRSISYVDLECEWCGEEYTKHQTLADESRFCSWKCKSDWESKFRVGENHPAWKGGEVVLICEYCGEEYQRSPCLADESRFCSNDCRGDWLSENVDHSGENHPAWKGGRVTLTCETCGNRFDVKPYRADEARFCSQKCTRTGEHLVCEGCGETFYAQRHTLGTARWCSVECMKNRITKTCETCGEEFEVIKAREDTARHCSWDCILDTETLICEICADEFEVQAHRADDARFCSTECTGKWISATWHGQGSPSWKGGYTIYRGLRTLLPIRWSNARDETRERAGYECEQCGAREETLHRELDVHHIVPVLSGGTNGKWNRMAVCSVCHKSAERFTAGLFDRPFTDWSDDELPDGRERWTPSVKTLVTEQTTITAFGSGD